MTSFWPTMTLDSSASIRWRLADLLHRLLLGGVRVDECHLQFALQAVIHPSTSR